MKTKLVIASFIVLVALVLFKALSFTPITDYIPGTEDEKTVAHLFVAYITARNSRDVDRFMSTLHDDCRYMITKDLVVDKNGLRGLLPGLWMQNDDDTMAFGKCMAWECWNENNYQTGMLVNPTFRIETDRAYAQFKFHSGLFMDENFFQLVREDGKWRIKDFKRPVY